jgi:hypothetical protein
MEPAANAAMKTRNLNAQMRELRLRREEAARPVLAEIDAARFARLPWPARAIGAMLDSIFRRPSPDKVLRAERMSTRLAFRLLMEWTVACDGTEVVIARSERRDPRAQMVFVYRFTDVELVRLDSM